MARKKKQPIIEKLKIESIAAEGKSLGRHEDQVIFVEKAVPGDVVDVQVRKKRKNYMEAYPFAYHIYSRLRNAPFCNYFGVCGGCKWQHLNYDSQIDFKQQQVVDSLSRIGKMDLPYVSPIIGSEKTTNYRNKVEFTFSNKQWLTKEQIASEEIIERSGLGFHVPRVFDKVVDVEVCHLIEEPANAIKNHIREYALAHKLEFFDIKAKQGLLRTLMIRLTTTREVMVLIQFFRDNKKDIEELMNSIVKKFPQITSLLYVINTKGNDTIYDQEVINFHGQDYITEKMDDLQFRIGPKSFYQTNSIQAQKLYEKALQFADLKGDELIYDLYTGTGTIANFVAKKAKKVIGIESVEDAIKDAFINSEINCIDNTDFYAGDMKDLLNDDFIAQHGKPNVVITDPPRAGMHDNVIKMLLKIAAKKIVYISCNPSTQARDIGLMSEAYKIKKIQPVDMFPQTHHVENIVCLELK